METADKTDIWKEIGLELGRPPWQHPEDASNHRVAELGQLPFLLLNFSSARKRAPGWGKGAHPEAWHVLRVYYVLGIVGFKAGERRNNVECNAVHVSSWMSSSSCDNNRQARCKIRCRVMWKRLGD
jgi:hypothetical protein